MQACSETMQKYANLHIKWTKLPIFEYNSPLNAYPSVAFFNLSWPCAKEVAKTGL